jgi:hypothetical protein
MGTAAARANVSPGDLGVLAGAGVVGEERCVDTAVVAGGEDMHGHAGDQRIEVYCVLVWSSLVQANARGEHCRRAHR